MVNMKLLRQILTILFLPIAILIFMIGWGLQWIGEKQNINKVEKPQRETISADGVTDEIVEVKVIAELMEKVIKTK